MASYKSYSNDDDFTGEFMQGLRGAGLGVNIIQAGQQIAANRKLMEQKQEDQDAFAAAELIKKMEASKDRPDEVRQLQNQFNGYTPRVKYFAGVHHLASQKMDNDVAKEVFQKSYREGLSLLDQSRVALQQGRTMDAMQGMSDILNKTLPDGNTYQMQEEGGKFYQVVYNRHGEETAKNVVDPQSMYEQTLSVLRQPDQAFSLFSQAYASSMVDNANEMNNFPADKTYVDPKTGEQFHQKVLLNRQTNIPYTTWFSNFKEVPAPDLSKLKNLKQMQAEQDRSTTVTKGELDITGKRLSNQNARLGIQINEENLKQERVATGKAESGRDDEPEAQRKVYERDVVRSLSTQFMKPNLKVDEDNLIVYSKNSLNEEVVDEKATKHLRKKFAETDEYIRKHKKPSESRAEALRRITDETVAKEQQLAGEDTAKKRSAVPSEARFLSRGVPVNVDNPAKPSPIAKTNGGIAPPVTPAHIFQEVPQELADGDEDPILSEGNINYGALKGGLAELLRKRREAVERSYVTVGR